MHRLTGEIADCLDVDAGHPRVDDRVDLVVIDPERLDDALEAFNEEPAPQYVLPGPVSAPAVSPSPARVG